MVLPNVNHESEQWLGTLTLNNIIIVPQKRVVGFLKNMRLSNYKRIVNIEQTMPLNRPNAVLFTGFKPPIVGVVNRQSDWLLNNL